MCVCVCVCVCVCMCVCVLQARKEERERMSAGARVCDQVSPWSHKGTHVQQTDLVER